MPNLMVRIGILVLSEQFKPASGAHFWAAFESHSTQIAHAPIDENLTVPPTLRTSNEAAISDRREACAFERSADAGPRLGLVWLPAAE
jgi:hypothetical protein